MRLNWKMLRWTAIPALLMLGAGCSGINTTQSISPASLLLPGLLQADPPPSQPAAPGVIPADEPITKIAQS